MASNADSRTALGAIPGAVNTHVGHNPVAAFPAATGQENAPIALPSAKPTAKPASRKRKSTEDHAPVAPAVDLDEIDLEGAYIDENCDQVRRKINRLLDSGAMTKTAFAKEIGVSAKSLSGFLGAHGQVNGSGFAAYGAAWEFFKKREMAGIKLPVKKQKTSPDTAVSAAAGAGTTASATSAKAKAATAVDLSDIHLDGEDDDAVPVFDTCDEVRRKINAHLKKPGVTQAQFCRDLHAQLKGPSRPEKPFQGTQLTRFRNSKGPLSGAKSSIFYAAYVFFEKMRIKEGKPKSKHRLEMEKQWGRYGIDRSIDGNTSFICRVGTQPYMDKYGKITVY